MDVFGIMSKKIERMTEGFTVPNDRESVSMENEVIKSVNQNEPIVDRYIDYGKLGKKIKKLRKNINLTQAALADVIGVSTSFMGHIERGTHVASSSTLVGLSRALDVSLDYLLFDKKAMKPSESLLSEDVEEDPYEVVDLSNVSFATLLAMADQMDVGIADLAAWVENKDEFQEISPTRVKRLVTGNGNATKEEVAQCLSAYVGKQEYECDDESDAVAAGIAWLLENDIIRRVDDG